MDTIRKEKEKKGFLMLRTPRIHSLNNTVLYQIAVQTRVITH